MGIFSTIFGASPTPPKTSLWPDEFAQQFFITEKARENAAAFDDISRSLAAIDECLAGGERVVLGSTLGSIPERAQSKHFWQGWIALSKMELLRHICAIGGSGSGKTSRLLYPLLFQVLAHFHDSSCFSICIKDSSVSEFRSILDAFGDRPYCIVQPNGGTPWNLLDGLTASEAAAMLSDIYSGKSDISKYFASLATRRAQAALTVVQALPIPRTLYQLYKYCFAPAFEKQCNEHALGILQQKMVVGSHDYEALVEALNFSTIEFGKMDHVQKSNISNTLSRSLGIFASPDIRQCFAPEGVDSLDIDHAIANGLSVAVHVPTEFRAEADTLYGLAKRRFSEAVFRRPMEKRNRLVLALLDEAQAYLSPQDGDLFDLARVYGLCICASLNSFSSFLSQFADRNLAMKIFENMSCKVIFDLNRDLLGELQAITGKAKVITRSKSTTDSSSETHAGLNTPGSSGVNRGGGTSQSETYIDLIDGSTLLNARDGEALVIAKTCGRTLVDLCTLPLLRPEPGEEISPDYPATPVWTPCPTVDPSGRAAQALAKLS